MSSEVLHEKPFCLILMAKWTVINAGVVIFDGIERHSTAHCGWSPTSLLHVSSCQFLTGRMFDDP